jgi:catechol 2,3-dioxygenase-like lactoylglutathione lyase family enzyme
MTAIRGAHHTSFTVANLEQSLSFFRDLLGLEVLGTREIGDAYFGRIVGLPGCRVKAALLRIPGSDHYLELFEYLTPAGQAFQPRPCDPGSSHLSFLVDDLPGLYQRLRHQVNFASEPVLIEAGPNRGGYGVYARDPNGILIEFFQLPPQANP